MYCLWSRARVARHIVLFACIATPQMQIISDPRGGDPVVTLEAVMNRRMPCPALEIRDNTASLIASHCNIGDEVANQFLSLQTAKPAVLRRHNSLPPTGIWAERLICYMHNLAAWLTLRRNHYSDACRAVRHAPYPHFLAACALRLWGTIECKPLLDTAFMPDWSRDFATCAMPSS